METKYLNKNSSCLVSAKSPAESVKIKSAGRLGQHNLRYSKGERSLSLVEQPNKEIPREQENTKAKTRQPSRRQSMERKESKSECR